MVRRMSRAQREQAFMEEARRMFNALEAWYDGHPDATFGEIEQEARSERRTFMGRALATLINGRDTGAQVQPPRCAVCGVEMTFEGYRDWTVYGLEGDTSLERAYYVCPDCDGQGLFPPGPQAEVAGRPLERRRCQGGDTDGPAGGLV
jgi:hypothetical protein